MRHQWCRMSHAASHMGDVTLGVVTWAMRHGEERRNEHGAAGWRGGIYGWWWRSTAGVFGPVSGKGDGLFVVVGSSQRWTDWRTAL